MPGLGHRRCILLHKGSFCHAGAAFCWAGAVFCCIGAALCYTGAAFCCTGAAFCCAEAAFCCAGAAFCLGRDDALNTDGVRLPICLLELACYTLLGYVCMLCLILYLRPGSTPKSAI